MQFQQLHRSLKPLWLLLFIGILSGCATVEIPNDWFCADMGFQGATCDKVFTSDTEDFAKAAWDAQRVGWICTPGDSFAGWKGALEELCNQTDDCDEETQATAAKFFNKIEGLRQRQRAKLMLK